MKGLGFRLRKVTAQLKVVTVGLALTLHYQNVPYRLVLRPIEPPYTLNPNFCLYGTYQTSLESNATGEVQDYKV